MFSPYINECSCTCVYIYKVIKCTQHPSHIHHAHCRSNIQIPYKTKNRFPKASLFLSFPSLLSFFRFLHAMPMIDKMPIMRTKQTQKQKSNKTETCRVETTPVSCFDDIQRNKNNNTDNHKLAFSLPRCIIYIDAGQSIQMNSEKQ